MEIYIEKMLSPKCPRCYDRNGRAENYQGMCDRCCNICMEALEDFVTFKMLTEEEAKILENGITEARKRQLEKYMRP